MFTEWREILKGRVFEDFDLCTYPQKYIHTVLPQIITWACISF